MARREMVTLQLFRDGRRIGPAVSAQLDWREDGTELRSYLVDAVAREGYPPRRIGEFTLEVRRAGNDRHLTTFVTTAEDRG